MRKIIWILGLILCLAGIIRANDKTEIVPYTQTSIQEFLNNPVFTPKTPVLSLPAIGDWTTGTFTAGDTLTTFQVTNAKVVRFVFADSSLAGVDTIGIKLKIPGPTTNYLYPSIMVRPMDDTTGTTNTGTISGDSLYTSSGNTIGYEYVPTNGTITGTFQVYRKNANAYAAKSRYAMQYE